MKAMFLVNCVMLFAGCTAEESQSNDLEFVPSHARVTNEIFGGTANREAVMSAPSVSACRLRPILDAKRIEVVEYREEAAIPLSAVYAERLRDILGDRHTYFVDMTKTCTPVFGVRCLFKTNTETIGVDLCFECDILDVTRDGKYVGGGIFDNGRPKLVNLCKELFPSDAEIQKLKP